MSVIYLSKVQDNTFPLEWYDASNENHFWFKLRLLWTKHLMNCAGIDFSSSLKVLDVGGGTGVFASQIENACSWEVDIVDLDLKALEAAPNLKGKKYFYDINEREASMKEKFDGIFIMDVVEHISNEAEFVNAALFHLKPGGFILIHVPAINLLMSPYDAAVGHLRRYSKLSLSEIIPHDKIGNVRFHYWGVIFIPILIARFFLHKILRVSKSEIIKSGFNPPSNLVNWIFYIMGKVDFVLLRGFPIGSSLFCLGVKK